jgi:hypothetical protein
MLEWASSKASSSGGPEAPRRSIGGVVLFLLKACERLRLRSSGIREVCHRWFCKRLQLFAKNQYVGWCLDSKPDPVAGYLDDRQHDGVS